MILIIEMIAQQSARTELKTSGAIQAPAEMRGCLHGTLDLSWQQHFRETILLLARSYAQALLQREMAVQSLQQRMWQEEVEESAAQGAAAKSRRAAAEEEEREATRDLDRVQAEGPANHRKRDPIDKVLPRLSPTCCI